MRRLIPSIMALCLATVATAPVTAAAQDEERPNPLDVIMDAFESPEGQEFVARFLTEPAPGAAAVTDPAGDFEHSTGEPPGFTPGHLDITSTWALEFDPGPLDFFTPTDANQLWAPTGRFDADPPNHDVFHTFTGDQVHDGSQYDDGALLFGFTLVDTPPVDAAGRCEYVVWVNDATRGDTFVNNPAFPGDPAGGTNVAFGLGLNPEQGPGMQTGFTLELQEDGGFVPSFDTDIRAFITPQYVGITVPRSQIGELAGINFYTFCVDEGFSFEPENTGGDQTGLLETGFDDLGAVVIETQDLPVETTTTTASPTTAAAPVTTIAEAAVTDPEDATDAGRAGFPWWFVVTAAGVGVALLGWWLYARGDDPCRKLLEAWRAAQRECDEAEQAALDAEENCDEAEVELDELEAERKEVCKAWPPACWTTEEGDWIEDQEGNRITSRDIHMRKVALGEVWADYKSGRLTAGEVEAKWREMDTPEFREDMRQTDDAFKDLLEDIDEDIDGAQERLDESCARAREARQRADEACEKATEARQAYEDCVGEAAAAAGDVPVGGAPAGVSPIPGGGTTTTTGPSDTTRDPCEGVEPKRKHEKAGEPERTRVYVDFSVITGVSSGSERRVAEGDQLVIELSDLATQLDFAGDMLNARSAGLHIKGAVNGYAQGKYVATGAGIVRGGIDAATATTDLVPDVPTTPVQAGVEGLEALTRLGGVIAGKVTEWMAGVQIMTVRLTMFYQDVTATPYEILECRKGQGWVCVEKVWEFEVGKLRRHQGRDRMFTVNSDVRKREFQRVIRGLSQRAAATVKQDAEELAEWRAKREPGPCE